MTDALAPVEPSEASDRPRTALVVSVVLAVVVAVLVAVLATRDGGTFSSADKRGRWVVLNFFGSWCVPCLEEHPELVAFDAAHRAEGDAVLVSTTFDDRAEDARAFFEEHGGTWPVIDDPENSIGVTYGVAQVPETFVISPNGTVVQRYAGPVTRAALDELIASYEEATP
jgi:cytochrome c biogenesis protein CcmG, thiol:disulfide interchange protein DsbE